MGLQSVCGIALLAVCVLCSCSAVLPHAGTAAGRGDCDRARVVLQHFLELDRTAGREWTPELAALITDTDGPGWDRQTVVNSYHIEGCTGTGVAELTIRYELLGHLEAEPGSGAVSFRRVVGNASERQVYRVVHTRDGMRVDGVGAIEPHIGKLRAIAQVESLLKTSGPQGASTAAQNVLVALRSLP